MSARRYIAARFRRAEAGGVSMLFALSLPAMLALVGGAADYAAIAGANARLQGAVDSAALSVAREMTLTALTPARVQDLATSYVAANIGAASPATVTGTLVENNTGVSVVASQPIKAPLGVLPAVMGIDAIQASATARIPASSAQKKLCMLSLGAKQNGGIFLHNGSSIQAPECVLHSNATGGNAVIVQQASKVKSNLLCARGGVQNLAGALETTVLSDCPAIADPLVSRPEPTIPAGCIDTKKTIKNGTVTLSPGNYCQGLFIEKSASVTLNPGVYFFTGGPLEVKDNAELRGNGVTLMFAGKNAFFRFQDNALIQLSAPTSGGTAGMLIWESKTYTLGANSWQVGGCGTGFKLNTALIELNIDVGPNGCSSPPNPGTVPLKKFNEHHIDSQRAKELTGTIYLPFGLLMIDSKQPIADQSPYTVLVANKVDLYDGPVLTLNSNYQGSPVPVPAGLGIIGARMVMLGR